MPEVAQSCGEREFQPSYLVLLWVYYERAALLLLPPAIWLSMGAFSTADISNCATVRKAPRFAESGFSGYNQSFAPPGAPKPALSPPRRGFAAAFGANLGTPARLGAKGEISALTRNLKLESRHWLLKYLRTYRIQLHCPLADVTLIQNGAELRSTCCLSPSAHRGRPAALGGNVEFCTCDHLKEDGVFCNSLALRGRSSCYFDFKLRGRRLNHANPEPNSLRLNIVPASLTGSIFCADFRLSPPVFSRFYEHRGGGRGALPVCQHMAIPFHRVPVVDHLAGNGACGEFRVSRRDPLIRILRICGARGSTHAMGEVVEEKSGAPGGAPPSHGGDTGQSHRAARSAGGIRRPHADGTSGHPAGR
jgi:hypothetical protein